MTPFEDFWAKYPARNGKKVGRAATERHWKQKKCDAIALEIMLALSVQIEHKKKCDAAGKFCAEFPDPERWIRHSRWRDEIVTDKQRHPMLAHLQRPSPGVYFTESQAGVVRRRELTGIVKADNPEMSPREVENEATKRWKLEGWEEKV